MKPDLDFYLKKFELYTGSNFEKFIKISLFSNFWTKYGNILSKKFEPISSSFLLQKREVVAQWFEPLAH